MSTNTLILVSVLFLASCATPMKKCEPMVVYKENDCLMSQACMDSSNRHRRIGYESGFSAGESSMDCENLVRENNKLKGIVEDCANELILRGNMK